MNGPWQERSRVPGTKVTGNERDRERSQEGKVCSVYSFSGTNGPGNERSRERMVPRTKVPSWEQMFQGSNSLENEYSSIPWQDSLFVLQDSR